MKKITSVKPYGLGILIELLEAQEALGTNIIMKDDAKIVGAPQGIILAFGDKVNASELGLALGDRVLLQGKGYVPVPNYDNSKRIKGIIEAIHIKAILS